MKLNISILGCGWLGLDLAIDLVNSGFKVKGSTTTKAKLQILKNHGIEPFLISLSEQDICGDIESFLSGSSILIIAIPPGLRKNPEKRYDLEMEFIAKAVSSSSVKYILYVGSTSVFKDDYDIPIIKAHTIPNSRTNAAKQLVAVEQMLCALNGISTTILRFAGLIGDDRHPGFYLKGRNNIPNPEGPVNLIHKRDCIGLIKKIILGHHWGKTWNAAFPDHPKRQPYYTNFCKKHGLPAPKFANTPKSKGKIIDSTQMAQILSFTFEEGLNN